VSWLHGQERLLRFSQVLSGWDNPHFRHERHLLPRWRCIVKTYISLHYRSVTFSEILIYILLFCYHISNNLFVGNIINIMWSVGGFQSAEAMFEEARRNGYISILLPLCKCILISCTPSTPWIKFSKWI
jgi:hypothetical protein